MSRALFCSRKEQNLIIFCSDIRTDVYIIIMLDAVHIVDNVMNNYNADQ